MKTGFYKCVLIFCSLTACSKEDLMKTFSKASKPGEERTFLIKKGNHAAEGNHFETLSRNFLNCQVQFDSSVIYESVYAPNQGDVNKLFGFSDCDTHHQENSARFGWAWNGKSLVLYAYAYVNSERLIKTLGTVPLYQPVDCSLKAEGNQYYFRVNDHLDSLPRHCDAYNGSRYRLYPYFGGDEVAPHDITIKIKELESSVQM
jgi:hypothetical protein